MKKFVAIAFAAASILAGPAIVVSTSSSALAATECGPDVPEEWLRPGGFCEQAGSNKSLVEPLESCEIPYLELLISSLEFEYGEAILVAEQECKTYYLPEVQAL